MQPTHPRPRILSLTEKFVTDYMGTKAKARLTEPGVLANLAVTSPDDIVRAYGEGTRLSISVGALVRKELGEHKARTHIHIDAIRADQWRDDGSKLEDRGPGIHVVADDVFNLMRNFNEDRSIRNVIGFPRYKLELDSDDYEEMDVRVEEEIPKPFAVCCVSMVYELLLDY